MSESIYIKNLNSLKVRFEDIVEYLNDENDPDDLVSEVIKIDGVKRLVVAKNDEYIQLESLYDGDDMFKVFFENVTDDWELDGKMFMFGLGNGSYARYFLNNSTSDHKIFVIEPSINIFKSVIENYDLTDLFDNDRFILTIIKGKDEKKYKKFFKMLFVYTDIFSAQIGACLNYDMLFGEEIECWHSIFSMTRENSRYINALYEQDGLNFIRNNYSSFEYFCKSLSLEELINEMPTGVPTIIVSAGPSLNKNINELKNAKGKALIIAVDAAINPMVENGILPDLMISLDATKGEEYIQEIAAKNIPLVCSMDAGRQLVEAHTGCKLYFSNYNRYLLEYFANENIELPFLQTGGSVSTSAFSLALLLKSETIILVGQDLAFTNNESHVRGSVRGDESMDEVNSIYDMDMDIDIYGNPVKSSKMFKIFKSWFETQIADNPGITVIDATEGGAKILGTSIMKLSEAIGLFCVDEFVFDDVLNSVKNVLDETQIIRFKQHINNLPKRLDEIDKKIEDGLECYESIRNIVYCGKPKNAKIREMSALANRVLDDIQKDAASEYLKYLTQTYVDEIMATIYATNKDVKKELLEICDIGSEYLSKIREAINELKQEIKII